jgi:chromosome segregation ATPase
LEKEMGDSFDKHAKQLDEVKKAHDKHTGHIDTFKSWKMHHSSLEERMGYLEKVLNDSADQHARMMTDMRNKHEELRSSHSRHASLEERVAFLENDVGASVDQHSSVLDDMRKSHDRILRDSQSRHTTLEERLAFVESAVGDSADKHAGALDALRQGLGKHARDLESLMAVHDKHASLADRLDAIEKVYRDSISQIGVLKTGYGNLANDLAAFRKMNGVSGSGSMEERLLNVERLIRQELSSAHEQLDVLAQSVQREAQSKLELVRGIRQTDAQVTQVIRSVSPDGRAAQSYSRELTPSSGGFTALQQPMSSGLISPSMMTATSPAARVPMATANVRVIGADRNLNGIPDCLEGGKAGMPVPVAPVPVPVATLIRSEPVIGAPVRNDYYGGVTPPALGRVAP